MPKALFTIILLITTRLGFSQVSNKNALWNLTIVDSTTLKAVESATVSIINKCELITNSKGLIGIDKLFIKNNHSLTISSIGYKTVLFSFNGTYPDTIKLATQISVLNEITIKANLKKVIVGYADSAFDGGYIFAVNSNSIAEIAEYIPNTQKLKGTILSLNFGLENNKKGPDLPFRVNLYRKVKGSMYPGEELIKDSIIVYNPQKLKVVTVDVASYNIKIPEDGFIIGLQALPQAWYDDRVNKSIINYQKVIKIRGHFNNHSFAFANDTTLRNSVRYSLLRTVSEYTNEWNVFEDGTNFSIGAVISPD
jgi:hypothetical protein